jgi:hypothetical protein
VVEIVTGAAAYAVGALVFASGQARALWTLLH